MKNIFISDESDKEFIEQHTKKANKFISKIFIILDILMVIVAVGSVVGFYNSPQVLSVGLSLLCIVCNIFFIVFQHKNYNSKVLKYLYVISTQLIIFFLQTNVNMQLTAAVIIIPVSTMIYLDPTVTLFSGILACLSHLLDSIIIADEAVKVLWTNQNLTPLQYILSTGGSALLEMVSITIVMTITTVLVRNFILNLMSQKSKKVNTYNTITSSLLELIEFRDMEAVKHVNRASKIVELFTNYLYENQLTDLNKEQLKNINFISLFHDVGKIKIKDAIIQKPKALTDEEFNIIKLHAIEGDDIMKHTLKELNDLELQQTASDLILYHHEKWDGTGYPKGLKGETIPVSARIMAVADVFDAMNSERPYRKALDMNEVFEYFEQEKGKQFDPHLIEILFILRPQIEEIYKK